MKTKILAGFSLAVVALSMASAPGFAHHGTGINYDNSHRVVMKGTVTEFAWKNPHTQLYMDVKDEKTGNVVHFAVEMNSPGVLNRDGWTRHEIKPGDEVSIAVYPSRAGAPVGECLTPSTCNITINGKPPVAQDTGDN